MELAVLYYNILEDLQVLVAGKAFPPRPLPAGIFSAESSEIFCRYRENLYPPCSYSLQALLLVDDCGYMWTIVEQTPSVIKGFRHRIPCVFTLLV